MKALHCGPHTQWFPSLTRTTSPVTLYIGRSPGCEVPSWLRERASLHMGGTTTYRDASGTPVVRQFAITTQFCFPENRPSREGARKIPTCRCPTPWQVHPPPFAPPPARHPRSGICSYRFSSLLSWRVGPASARLAREASIGWRKTSCPARQSILTSCHLRRDRSLRRNDIATRAIINQNVA